MIITDSIILYPVWMANRMTDFVKLKVLQLPIHADLSTVNNTH